MIDRIGIAWARERGRINKREQILYDSKPYFASLTFLEVAASPRFVQNCDKLSENIHSNILGR